MFWRKYKKCKGMERVESVFFALCYDFFQRISDVHGLKKNVENYQKLQYYKMNLFYKSKRYRTVYF